MFQREDESPSFASAVTAAIQFVYESYNRLSSEQHVGYDRDIRHPEWTRELLDRLGNPDFHSYNIAVTGSKGKGSHAILIAAILQQVGLRVGLFTSPHLVNFLERIRVDGSAISDEDFLRMTSEVRTQLAKLRIPEGEYIGPVGIVAAMAALYFRERQMDVGVYELGRGARFDDVNQVRHQGAVFTPIFPEHLDKLGPTWSDVVDEKMGVLSHDTSWMVSYEQSTEVWDQMIAEDSFHGESHSLGGDISYEMFSLEDGGGVVCAYMEGNRFRASLSDSLIPFGKNVAVALVAAACALRDMGRDYEQLDVDLRKLSMPGRLQIIASTPTVLLDGAIHAVNAQFVLAWLKSVHRAGRIYALFSFPDDKDIVGVMDVLAPHIDTVIFTTSTNHHLAFTRDLRPFAADVPEVDVIPDVVQAVRHVMERADVHDIVLCVGTQSFVGDMLRYFQVPTETIW